MRTDKKYGEIDDHHFAEFHYADGSILNSQCGHIPRTMSKVDELLIGTKEEIYGDAAVIKDHRGNTLFAFDKRERIIRTRLSVMNSLPRLRKESIGSGMQNMALKAR